MIYEWLLKRKHVVIDDECTVAAGIPLLHRWELLRFGPEGKDFRGGTVPAYSLMLHCFLRNDNDRHFHDHPWSFLTFLLSPYIEHTPHGIIRHRRFRLLYRPSGWQHWVEVIQPRTWTLLIHFRRHREWGFTTPTGWVHWKAYINGERCK